MIQSLSSVMLTASTGNYFDVGNQDNNPYIEAHVFFDGNAPMLSRHILDNHQSVFNQLPSQLLTAHNKPYLCVEVQIPSWEFKRFSQDMKKLNGVLGMTLTKEATKAESKQYGRHCFAFA